MKNLKTYVGKAISIERMKSSVNGNARFAVDIQMDNGNVISCCTAPDCSYADVVKNLYRDIDPMVVVEIGTHRRRLTINSIARV